MLKKIKEAYKKELEDFNRHYRLYFWVSAIVMALVAFGSCLIFARFPSVPEAVVRSFAEALNLDQVDSYGGGLFWFIFLHNLQSVFWATLSGVLLFFVPFLFIVLNAFTLGMVMALLQNTGQPLFESFVKYILPHGIFELPAIFYAVSIGIFLNIQILKKIFPETRQKSLKTREILVQVVRSYVLIVIPLVLVAGLIESFITALFVK